MKIALVFNRDKEEAKEFINEIKKRLLSEQTKIFSLDEIEDRFLIDSQIIITAGGDGTTLKTIFFVANNSEPPYPFFLSVNFGRRGYLSSCKPDEFFNCFNSFKKSQHKIIRRYLAELRFLSNEKKVYFLNEATIIRHNDSQVIDLQVSCKGLDVQLKADGIIAATETGSTAYVYSAGGARVLGTETSISMAFLAPEEKIGPFVIGNKSQPIKIFCRSERASLSLDGSIYENKGPYQVEVISSNRFIDFVSTND
ncbi:MAG: NAD(+)/NADH kinase [Actinobacteria bacterium]|nr:NAD(+)/NADH kinase [Actinomycetota bacterium]